MDPDQPPRSTPRKVKFTPKPPPLRTSKPIPAKIDAEVEDDADKEVMKQFISHEHRTRLRTKNENKSPSQVAFSHGAGSTSSIQTFGKQKENTDDGKGATSSIETIDVMQIDDRKNRAPSSKETLDENDMQKLATYTSTDAEIATKKKIEHEEAWGCDHSNCPITLPWRRPNSGNPELLDKAEFEEAKEYDENAMSSASELGLLDQDDKPRMLFVQLPKLPLGSSHSSRASIGKEVAGSSTNQDPGYCNLEELPEGLAGSSTNQDRGYCNLEELPEGRMGKMLVHKSGAVKLKLGDVSFDVSPGTVCMIPQSVMAINAADGQCCNLGDLDKRVVVTPDIDSLLKDAP